MDNELEALRMRRGFIKNSIGAASSMLLLRSAASPGIAEKGIVEPVPVKHFYTPTYFTPEEWEFIAAAVDRLIPANADGPGALELGVAEFIDRQMETDYGHGARWYLQGPFHPEADFTLGYQMQYTPRDMYRVAIAAINRWTTQQYAKKFSTLDSTIQDHILSLMEKNLLLLENVKANEFFLQLLGNTKEGYFADPLYGGNRGMASWKMIGFPGARADFKDWSNHPGRAYPLGPVSIQGENT